jgi:peptidoglycan hydrolase-like protein with peptidoglycan-binding domain
MEMNAYDMDSVPTPEMIPAMKASGITACIIYSRLITLDVAQLLSANDIDIVLVAEWGTGAQPSHYTAANGLTDAQRFLSEIAPLGIKPPGAYFCNGDFDASMAQITGGITDYRRAVKNVLDSEGIGAGGYGNGANMQTGLDDGTIAKAFVWAGMGTLGTPAFIESGRWSIRQYPTMTEFGASVDPDEVQGDYWGFRVPVATAQPMEAQPSPWRLLEYAEPLMTGDDVAAAQRLLGVSVDGIFGRQTQAAVRSFQQLHGLPADGIIGPATMAMLSAPA